MQMASFVKVAVLAFAVALPASFSVAEAAKAKMPPGACALDKKTWMASASFCSFNCDPKTQWCLQQFCLNGQRTPAVPCFDGFCSPKCGG